MDQFACGQCLFAVDLFTVCCLYSLQAELEEDKRLAKVQNRTTGDKCCLYTVRFLINLVVTVSLGGAVFAIITIVAVSTNPVSILFNISQCNIERKEMISYIQSQCNVFTCYLLVIYLLFTCYLLVIYWV